MRGLYYAIDWDSFRLQALAYHSLHPEEAEWPADDVWVVKADAKASKSTRDGAPGPRKKRRVEDEGRSESSDDASGDEFEAPLRDESEDEDDDDADEDDVVAELEPRTPSRKRKRAETSTPRTPRRTGTASTATTPPPSRSRQGRVARAADPALEGCAACAQEDRARGTSASGRSGDARYGRKRGPGPGGGSLVEGDACAARGGKAGGAAVQGGGVWAGVEGGGGVARGGEWRVYL